MKTHNKTLQPTPKSGAAEFSRWPEKTMIEYTEECGEVISISLHGESFTAVRDHMPLRICRLRNPAKKAPFGKVGT